MAAIRSKDTKPEVYLRKQLYSRGYRYRKNSNNIFGHPDIFLLKYNTAVFVHGCYWHRHKGCKYAYVPKSNVEFWKNKFGDNIKRDLTVQQVLLEQGIRIIIVWECTVKKMIRNVAFNNEILQTIDAFLINNRNILEI